MTEKLQAVSSETVLVHGGIFWRYGGLSRARYQSAGMESIESDPIDSD